MPAFVTSRLRSLWLIGLALAVVLIASGYAVQKLQESPNFCASACHTVMGRYVDSYYNSTFLVRTHASAGMTCADCHERTLPKQANEFLKFVTGNYRTPLRQLKLDDAMCFRCHVSMGEVATGTSALERNPHADPHHENHCSTCHKMHAPRVDYCGKCHKKNTKGFG